MLCAASQVKVGHVTAIHTFLNGEVEYGLLVAVLNAGNACLVALLVVELHVLYNADGQVFQRRFNVAEHEFFAVKQNFFNLLAVDGNVSVLIDLGSWHAFDKFLDGRAFWCAVGVWVIDQRVLLDDNLCCTSCDNGFLEQHGIGRHQQVAQVLTLVATY